MVVPLAVGMDNGVWFFRSGLLPLLCKLLQHWDFVQFLPSSSHRIPVGVDIDSWSGRRPQAWQTHSVRYHGRSSRWHHREPLAWGARW